MLRSGQMIAMFVVRSLVYGRALSTFETVCLAALWPLAFTLIYLLQMHLPLVRRAGDRYYFYTVGDNWCTVRRLNGTLLYRTLTLPSPARPRLYHPVVSRPPRSESYAHATTGQ